MFKKPISIILALLILTAAFSAAPLTASAENTPAEPEAESMKTGIISSDSDIAAVGSMYDSDFEYELLEDGTAKITGFGSFGFPNEVTVPSSLGGHKVTEIGTLVFRFDTNITKIVLPDGLKVIDSYASSGCSNLTEVVIPDSVTTIGEGAFYGSPKLTEVEIPAGVTEIGPLAFGWYWDSSAEDDVKVTDLNIRSKSGTVAEKYAKDNGFGFTDVSGSSGSLGSSFTWTLDSDGTLTITGKGAMSDISGAWGNKVKKAVIQKGITSIGAGVFSDCTAMTEVVIPNTVTSIGEGAFYRCTSLTSVDIPKNVNEIGGGAFNSCSSLTKIELPEGIKTVSNSLFAYCTGLKSVTLPSTVTKIDDNAFYQCTNLPEITLPDSISEIGKNAFCLCSNLYNINIPKNVKNIDSLAFGSCKKLSQVYITDLAAWLDINFVDEASNPLRYNNADLYLNGVLLTDPVIPSSVTRIRDYSFNGCNSIKSVTIPEGVIDIGERAFYDCSSLTAISFSDTVKTIGNDAFYNCPKLSSLELPDSVTSVGGNAFYGCKGLKKVRLSENLTKLEYGTFQKCEYLPEVIIPDSLRSISDYAFYECYRLGSVTIPETVEEIGFHAFFNTSWYNRLYNSSPDGVIYINKVAIRYKGSDPSKLVIKDGTISISPRAFNILDSTTEVSLPDSLKYIGYEAFDGCDGLTEITIPDSVTSIDEGAFFYCDNLKSVTVSDNVKTVGSGAFSYTPWLNSQPDGMFYIGKAAYTMIGDCPAEVVLKEGTVSISPDAFYGEKELESITIPDSVTLIDAGAFFGCSNLKSITIPASVTEIGFKAIGYDGNYYYGYTYRIEDFTIYGYTGSAAEKYANENGFKFIPIKDTDDNGVTVKGSITSYLDNSDVTIKLSGSGFTAEVKGKADYSIADVPAGEYTLTVSKANHVTREYKITVGDTDKTQDVKINPLGDVNGDGEITQADSLATIRQVRLIKDITDDYQLKCADINGDGEITQTDALAILRHVRLIKSLY